VIALALHALLLSLDWEWAKVIVSPSPTPQILTLCLSYKETRAEPPLPEKTPPDTQETSRPWIEPPPKKTPKIQAAKKHEPLPDAVPEKPSRPEDRNVKTPDLFPLDEGTPQTPQETREPDEKPAPLASVQPSPAPATKPPPSPPADPIQQILPVYLSNPSPEYPATARRRGYEGTVVVEVLVSKEGRVQDLRMFQSSGYAVLDRAATAAVRNWLFEPGRVGERKTAMWVKVPFRFELK
jgi:protein TonB